jgi:toxin YoeB
MTFLISFSDVANKDIESHKKSGNKNNLKRIQQILEELSEHPETGIGSPERLKYSLSGY